MKFLSRNNVRTELSQDILASDSVFLIDGAVSSYRGPPAPDITNGYLTSFFGHGRLTAFPASAVIRGRL